MIDAYREVTKQVPEAQLAMVGSMATDDPEGWEFFQQTFEYADADPDIKILNNLNNVGAIEVNAFQSQSDVCLQKSIREGFGLTVTEALWKGRPTVAGNVGGIPLQIEDGVERLPRRLAVGVRRSAASRSSPTRSWASASAAPARSTPASEFLSPRLLRDWLGLFERARQPERLESTSGSLCGVDSSPLIIVSNRGPPSSSATRTGSGRCAAAAAAW